MTNDIEPVVDRTGEIIGIFSSLETGVAMGICSEVITGEVIGIFSPVITGAVMAILVFDRLLHSDVPEQMLKTAVITGIFR